MSHLTETTLRELLQGAAPSREVLEHLETECEQCDALLAEHPAFDGEVDALLLRGVDTAGAPLDELGWRRLRSRLRGTSRWYWLAAPLAAAAVLSVVFVRSSQSAPDLDAGEKGSPAVIGLELTAAFQTADGRFERVEPGGTVSANGALVFKATVSKPTRATLWVQRAHRPAERFGDLSLEPSNDYLESTPGKLLAFSLQGEEGPLTVWLVAPAGISRSPEETLAALGHDATGVTAVAHLEVTVQP